VQFRPQGAHYSSVASRPIPPSQRWQMPPPLCLMVFRGYEPTALCCVREDAPRLGEFYREPIADSLARVSGRDMMVAPRPLSIYCPRLRAGPTASTRGD